MTELMVPAIAAADCHFTHTRDPTLLLRDRIYCRRALCDGMRPRRRQEHVLQCQTRRSAAPLAWSLCLTMMTTATAGGAETAKTAKTARIAKSGRSARTASGAGVSEAAVAVAAVAGLDPCRRQGRRPTRLRQRQWTHEISAEPTIKTGMRINTRRAADESAAAAGAAAGAGTDVTVNVARGGAEAAA